jgi:hypothetical protein
VTASEIEPQPTEIRLENAAGMTAAEAEARTALGSGPTATRGVRKRTTALSPYSAAAGLLPLLFLLGRRGVA